MPKINNKTFYTTVGIVMFFVLSAVFAYGTNFGDPVTSLFKSFYPAAIVGGEWISIYDLEQHRDLAVKLDPKANRQTISDAYLDQRKKESVFESLKLGADISEINKEFLFAKSDSQANYEQAVRDYFGGDEKRFIKYVVFPAFYDAQLRIAYNQDTKSNSVAFNRAKNLQSRISGGASFDEVAKLESEDETSAQIGGDLGLVTANQILPELSEALQTSEVGKIKSDIVVSRFGYHILYPVASGERNGEKVWHLKHILVETTGYNEWISSKIADVSVWRLK